MNSKEKVELLCKTLAEKKAMDIIKIDISDKSILADYFVIASGKSKPQVKSLCEYCEEAIEKNGGTVKGKEGLDEARWCVIDFGDVILHIFNDETRLFYNLERLWADGANVEKVEE